MWRYLLFKYLRFDKTQPFIMLSMILAFFFFFVGLCVLLVAMAIMNGFSKDFKERFFVMNYPLTIVSKFTQVDDELVNELKNSFPTLNFSPYISTQVIARGENKFEGGILFGINSKDEKKINKIVADALKDKELKDYDILIGSALFKEFRLNTNDKLSLIFSNLSPNALALIPQSKRFDVKFNFTSGLSFYDKAYMYADVGALRKLLNVRDGLYHGIHVYSSDAQKDLNTLQSFLGEGFLVFGWWEDNANLFSALELEKTALFIVLMLIILVASLNIVSSLLMIVMNRRSEIALLLALGASKKEIKTSFFALGCLVGFGGMIAGIILAFFAMWILGNFNIIELPADVYGSSKLPLDLSALDFIYTVLGASFIVALSSYYPARKATQVDVLETLRNE